MSTDAVNATPPSSSNTKPVLPDDPLVLQQMVRELLATLAAREREMEQVRQRLSLILQKVYGRRSERINPAQLLLFDNTLAAAESEATALAEEEEPAAPAAPRRQRRGHGRQELPKDLPRIPVIHDLTEAERTCPDCGHVRVKIGEEVSAQLDYQPASLFVLEHIRYTYACSHCHGAPATAAKPPQPIDKGLPGPGLLAQVVTSKYADHLPLYRQERILERFGVSLSRSTLCDWMARAAALLQPLYQQMVEAVQQSRVLHTDDTPIAVQEPKTGRTKTGRLWVYLGDAAHPHNVFEYTPNRCRDGPAQFLKNFTGYLQADAFGGYDGIYLTQPVIEVGCNAHARRKFFDAKESDAVRAHQALAFYRQLYEVEREAAEVLEQRLATGAADRQEILEAERLRLRREKSVPLLTTMCQWLKEQQPLTLPKSPIGQAIAYVLNHWQALIRYTEHGFLAIDNNWAEREMKKLAIGRKNWLFFGSDRGGRTAAVLFSVVSSCQRHGQDPFRYLEDVFYRLPGLPADARQELLPDRWLPAQAVKSAPSTPDTSGPAADESPPGPSP